MKHKIMVLTGALLAVLFAVSCKNECAFEPVYKDMLDVVDNPAKMDEKKLAESKLSKLWDKSAVIDSMEKRVVVYGKGLNVKPAANNYGFVYEKTSPHAFALQITTFMDPEVSVDFANKDDADKFYAEIVDFGMVEDEFNCRFVTEKRLSPGVTKIKNYDAYARTICVQKPAKREDGWYTIVFGN